LDEEPLTTLTEEQSREQDRKRFLKDERTAKRRTESVIDQGRYRKRATSENSRELIDYTDFQPPVIFNSDNERIDTQLPAINQIEDLDILNNMRNSLKTINKEITKSVVKKMPPTSLKFNKQTTEMVNKRLLKVLRDRGMTIPVDLAMDIGTERGMLVD
jgi:hypothetical protein